MIACTRPRASAVSKPVCAYYGLSCLPKCGCCMPPPAPSGGAPPAAGGGAAPAAIEMAR